MIVEPSREDVSVTAHAEAGTSSLAPVIGRETELHALSLLLQSGGTAVVNVTGARGSGKSALVRAALAGLPATQFVEIQRLDLSGETLASAMVGLRRHVSHAPIPLRRGDSPWDGERMLLHLE